MAPSDPDTICGYAISDIRKSLRDAIDRRERRAAMRWTAELVVTPGAVGSLWASYWIAWASATGQASPVLPILLKQSWVSVTDAAHLHAGSEGSGWTGFRNDPQVRALCTETTQRLLDLPRQTPVIWPSKELTLYDVGTMRNLVTPAEADGPVVMDVWQRNEDGLELRLMAGRFLKALGSDELRSALSAVMWSLMSMSQQGLALPLKIAPRGPASLPAKVRESAIWFWLELGGRLLSSQSGLHRGWKTFHVAVVDAFRTHWKRWTATERMRVLLAWILQLRAALSVTHPESLWAAPPIQLTLVDIDLPYKEVAAELADPNRVITQPVVKSREEADSKQATLARIESKMAEADAAILAAMGIQDS